MRTADVLLSVYGKEHPDYLDACLNSLVHQTHPADLIILVKDGPLGEVLDGLIERYIMQWPNQFRIVDRPEKPGLVKALNYGLEQCNSRFLFRVDSDDIAVPERFEKQLAFLEQHPETGVVSSSLMEFSENPGEYTRIKPAPVTHDEIRRQFPLRNPINQPSVCMRTQILKDLGGYPDVEYLEDYMLWARMLVAGVKFHNLPEALQYYRFNQGNLVRRGGYRNLVNECRIRWYLYKNNQAHLPITLFAMLAQVVLRLTPTPFRQWLWSLSRKPRQPKML